MPVNEGISYPVDDESLPADALLSLRRPRAVHGLVRRDRRRRHGGLMTIVETPDDAAVRVPRVDGLLCAAPQWEPQKGQFGHVAAAPLRLLRRRRLRGHVPSATAQHAKQTGLLKTLAEKRKANPNVDLLVGAVNVWCWDKDAVGHLPRDAGGRHRPHPVEQPRQARAARSN